MRRYLNQTETKLLNEIASQPDLIRSMIIKLWNADNPHFNGDAGHRYVGKNKYCSYCNRPKNWEPRNVFFNEDGTENKE